MPSMDQLSKFTSMTGRMNSNFSAAMPIYDQPEQPEKIKAMNFAKHVRIPLPKNFIPELKAAHQEIILPDQMLASLNESDPYMDEMVEEAFDEAAVPVYQMIQTYDRKKLKMKKHKRQKRKDAMRIKLKWSGKL